MEPFDSTPRSVTLPTTARALEIGTWGAAHFYLDDALEAHSRGHVINLSEVIEHAAAVGMLSQMRRQQSALETP